MSNPKQHGPVEEARLPRPSDSKRPAEAERPSAETVEEIARRRAKLLHARFDFAPRAP